MIHIYTYVMCIYKHVYSHSISLNSPSNSWVDLVKNAWRQDLGVKPNHLSSTPGSGLSEVAQTEDFDGPLWFKVFVHTIDFEYLIDMHRSCLGHVPLDRITSKNRIVMAKAQVFFKSSFCRLSLADCSMSGFRLFLEIQETLKIQTQCGTGIVYLQTSKSEAILQDGDAVLGALNDNRRFSVAGRSQEMLACCLPMLKMDATCARLTGWLCLIGMMTEMFFWSCQTWDADIWCASSFAQWSGYVMVPSSEAPPTLKDSLLSQVGELQRISNTGENIRICIHYMMYILYSVYIFDRGTSI